MKEPLVSIIITTHRGSDSIIRCVQSVLNQVYKPIEVIVVDDNGLGSEEQQRTEKSLAEFIQNGQVKYKAHEFNKNGSAARNTGFALSKGDLIGFIDDDDQYLPDKLSKSVDVLTKLDRSWGGCYTDAIVNKGNHEQYQTFSNIEGHMLFQTLCHLVFMNPSTLVLRREVVQRLHGFDESFQRHQDFEFNARLANLCKLKHINYVGSIYNSQNHRHYNKERAIEYRSFYIKKMQPLILQFSLSKQKIIATRNAVEVFGVKIDQYSKCKELCKEWGYSINLLSYINTLVMTYIERKKLIRI